MKARRVLVSVVIVWAAVVSAQVAPPPHNAAPGERTLLLGAELQQTALTAADGAASDHFGHSVAISDDGTTAAIGVPDHTIGGITAMGAVYVFVSVDGAWSLQQKLTAGDGNYVDQFGSAVALSANGNILVVGAMRADITIPDDDRGAAYVFMRSGSTWSQWQKLTASDATVYSYAGGKVAVSYDASTIAIGATHHTSASPGNEGAVFVFYRGSLSLFWSQQQTLLAPDRASCDYLGSSVALSSDGNQLISGAWSDDVGANEDQGSAYIFARSGSTWSLSQKILAFDGATDDRFGNAVALSGDGTMVAVGACRDDTGSMSGHGSVYIFEYIGGSWTVQQKLTAADPTTNDEFGYAVAFGRRANSLVIGAQRADAPQEDQGAAYTFTLANGTWSQQYKLTDSTPHLYAYLGNSVAMSADGAAVLVGASYDSVGSNSNQGTAHVFTIVRDTGFVTITPCRVFDTRLSSGPEAGWPILTSNQRRLFSVAGKCGVPVDAHAISANLTAVNATAIGDLRITAGHLPTTLTSVLSVPLTRARANNAIIQLSNDGSGQIAVTNATAGELHLILDVNGYFR